ncbi:MAG: hypothetical protein LBL85_06190 [Methanocalculaceae archaeon]|jgi:hypothetical protein|nr:hypothetical protein [Methanocalculaceae archaeon]
MVDPEPVPAADQKKGILGKIFDKKPELQTPVEKTIVEYFSLYSYLKEV